MQDTISAGQSVESYCGKCKVNRDHTIMTMEGNAVAKVRCKTCGSMHKFRDRVAPHIARKAGAKAIAQEQATTALVWEASLAKARGKERDYDMTAAYSVGEVVNHHTFGKGLVLKIHSNKCHMLFQDKDRLMATANQ